MLSNGGEGTDPCSHTNARGPSLPLLTISTSVIGVNTSITNHLPNAEGWKAKLAWLADP